MSSCFSRCLRVPIAIRAFYESYLWILQTLLLRHPDLHPGLLGALHELRSRARFLAKMSNYWHQSVLVSPEHGGWDQQDPVPPRTIRIRT